MARPKRQRRAVEAGISKEEQARRRNLEQNLAKDYKAYIEYAKEHGGDERKRQRFSFDEFRTIYERYYEERLAGTNLTEKNIRRAKLGETIFEEETSAFTEKQFTNIRSAIDRAKKELKDGTFTGEGDPEDIVAFIAATADLDDAGLRHNWNENIVFLKGLFGSQEEFNKWISPTFSFNDI